MRISNKNARYFVKQCREFKGNNTFGEWIDDDTYKVFSYGYHFPMYAYSTINHQWYRNKDKYSITTSKHQNLLRPVGIETFVYLNTNEMIKLNKGSFKEEKKEIKINGLAKFCKEYYK